MELTSNPDILRVAKIGTKFFVNGVEMVFSQSYNRFKQPGGVYLFNETRPGFFGPEYGSYVRFNDGSEFALFRDVEELIDRLKTGRYLIG